MAHPADGVRFEDIEAEGVEGWPGTGGTAEEEGLPTFTVSGLDPEAERQLRPLAFRRSPTVVPDTAMLVLEPIFEADLLPEQYAYRAERGAQDA